MRERVRERERERETDRQTERQKDTETDINEEAYSQLQRPCELQEVRFKKETAVKITQTYEDVLIDTGG